jgi:hypothetical protein
VITFRTRIPSIQNDANKYHRSVSRKNKSAAAWVLPEQWWRNAGMWNVQNVMHSGHQQFDIFLFHNYSSILTTVPMWNPLFHQFVPLHSSTDVGSGRPLCDSEGWLANSKWPDWLDLGLAYPRTWASAWAWISKQGSFIRSYTLYFICVYSIEQEC